MGWHRSRACECVVFQNKGQDRTALQPWAISATLCCERDMERAIIMGPSLWGRHRGPSPRGCHRGPSPWAVTAGLSAVDGHGLK